MHLWDEEAYQCQGTANQQEHSHQGGFLRCFNGREVRGQERHPQERCCHYVKKYQLALIEIIRQLPCLESVNAERKYIIKVI